MKKLIALIGILSLSIAVFGATINLVPASSAWKYKTTATSIGTTWKDVTFNDSSWLTGNSELGYGDGGEATVIPGGPSNNHYVTAYFRKTFTITDVSQITALTMTLVRDDGAVVYINGYEVGRSNMPTGTISYTTKASSTVNGSAESVWNTVTLTSALSRLVNGTNIISVEVHQRNATSSDVSFNLKLDATTGTGGGGTGTCTVPNLAQFGNNNKTATSVNVYWMGVSGATGYNVIWRTRGTSAAWGPASYVTATSLNITGLIPLTNYEFQVQTVCSAGTSLYSASGWFTTLSGSVSCAAPSGLTVTAITDNTATVSWTSVSGATGYNIYYNSTAGSSTVTSATNSKVLTGLTSGTFYQFQVQTQCSSGLSAYTSGPSFTTTGVVVPGLIPRPDHVVVVILENRARVSIQGVAPRLTDWANDPNTANFSSAFGMTHPSQPNYIYLYSGSNQGIMNNVITSSQLTTPNFGSQLLNAGYTFKGYSQGLPSTGSLTTSSGNYRRRHNPWSNWQGTGTNQIPSSLNVSFTQFPTDFSTLPTFCYVVPDLQNDMHDGTVATGDAWVYANLGAYYNWCQTNNSILVVTFDEDDGSHANNIFTIISGKNVLGGVYSQTINLTTLLGLFEDMYGLPRLNGAGNQPAIDYCWRSTLSLRLSNVIEEKTFDVVYPNPTDGLVNIESVDPGTIELYGLRGELLYRREHSTSSVLELDESGVYIVRIIHQDHTSTFKVLKH